MTSLPYDEQYTDHTHSLCLYRLRGIFEGVLSRLVIYNARSHGLTKPDSWKAVKGVLHAVMGTIESNLKEQGFKSHDPSGLPVPKPKMLVGAGAITFYVEEGGGALVQRHVGVMEARAALEDNISVLNKGFTRGHNMTREEGWTVVRTLLDEAEKAITEGVKREGPEMKGELKAEEGAGGVGGWTRTKPT